MKSAVAANRFGLGARPGELQQIGSDTHDWLVQQIEGERVVPAAIQALPSSAKVFEMSIAAQAERRAARQEMPSDAQIAQQIATTVREKLAPMYAEQVAARYSVAIRSSEPFRERLVHFWSNHFAVSADKIAVLALAGTLENEAVRPNLSRRFVDLLLAVEAHPAMILYLDNQASAGPNSQLALRAQRRGRDIARKPDINENLAREILELHTLGVNGGYSQSDVTSFAKALTGWSVGNRGLQAQGQPGEFVFREALHEPGPKQILGKRYPQEGVSQARGVIEDLARHPATAMHVATKLVRHFVADDPPAAAVQSVAKAFRDSDGDLPTVHRALIDLPHPWMVSARAKFKTPHEFVISSFRALDFVPQQPQQLVAPFQLLGQRPYAPGSPAGWPDTAAHWDGPDALLKRIEWATAIGERVGRRSDPVEIAEHALGAMLSERTRQALARAASAAQGIALLLASPEFMRR